MNKSIFALTVLGGLTLVWATFAGPAAVSRFDTQEPIPYPLWSTEEIAASGYAHALALDSADRPHLLFHDPNAGMLRYATRDQSGWSYDDVAVMTVAHPDMTFDMSIGQNDIPCIVYATDPEVISFPLDTTLTYGCRQGKEWQLASIDDGGRDVKLVIDADNQPHIALVQGQQAAYLTIEADEWIKEYVATDSAFMGRVWLDLDNQGVAHLIYYGSEGTFEAVRQAQYLWTITPFPMSVLVTRTFDSADRSWMLVTESEAQSGHPPFSFTRLFLAVPDGVGSWFMDKLGEDYDWHPAADLAVIGSDTAHVVFRDAGGAIHYRWWSSYAGWQSHSPDNVAGADLHLVLGSDAQPRLSFGKDGKVFLATRRIVLLKHFSYLPAVNNSP